MDETAEKNVEKKMYNRDLVYVLCKYIVYIRRIDAWI